MNCFSPSQQPQVDLQIQSQYLSRTFSSRSTQCQPLSIKIKSTKIRRPNHSKHFIDRQFKHTNKSAGLADFEPIEWLPASRLIPPNTQPIYSTIGEQGLIGDVGFQNPYLKDSLYFLMHCLPMCVIELLNRGHNAEGAYTYPMMRQGIIVNTIVDQYVPTIHGKAVYTAPFKNKIYPSLIEKAVAKNFGGYDRIPRSVPQIMQCLCYFPRKTLKPPRSQHQPTFIQHLFKSLNSQSLILFRTLSTPKLLSCGLQPDTYYLLYTLMQVILNNSQILVAEILEPRCRQRDWKGKYSNHDPIWREYQSPRKCKASTMMAMRDVFEVAEEFVVMRDNRNLNVNWMEAVATSSRNAGYFEVNAAEGGRVVFMSYLVGGPARNVLMLVEKLLDGYRLVAGNMEEWSNTNSIEAELRPGKHILYVKTQWPDGNSSTFNLMYCYSLPISISQIPKPANFLSLLFAQHSLHQNQTHLQVIRKEPLQLVSLKILYEQTGFAYISLLVAQESATCLRMEFDGEEMEAMGFRIKKPYRVSRNFTVDVRPGENKIIVFKVICQNTHEKLIFPPSSLKLYEI